MKYVSKKEYDENGEKIIDEKVNVMIKKCFFKKIIQLLFITIIINCFTSYIISEPTSKILIGSIENGTIKLFNLKNSNVYVLSESKKEKKFVWKGISTGNWKPHIETFDLNNDGKKEIIVHVVVAEGTNCYAEEIHIIDSNSLREIKIENPLNIVKNNNLIAKLGAKSNSLTTIGYIYVEYTFKNKTIKFKRIYFKPN